MQSAEKKQVAFLHKINNTIQMIKHKYRLQTVVPAYWCLRCDTIGMTSLPSGIASDGKLY